MRFLLALFLLLLSLLPSYGHSGQQHLNDIRTVFGGYGGQAFDELAQYINHVIDTELPNEFRQKIGPVPGNHRVLGHGWALDAAIPKKTLEAIEQRYPGKKGELIDIWKRHVDAIHRKAAHLSGLPEKQSKALASIMYNVHLLGDIEPGNVLHELVLAPDDIARNIAKNAETLFQNAPAVAKKISERLNAVLKNGHALGRQQLAQALMTELYRLNLGSELNACCRFGLRFDYAPHYSRMAETRRAMHQYKNRTGREPGVAKRVKGVPRIGRAPFVSALPTNLEDLKMYVAEEASVKLCKGLYTSAGKMIVQVNIPGVEAGLLVCSADAGVATYQYFSGAILKEEFERKLADAAVRGVACGVAHAVLVALVPTPGGILVAVVGIGAYYVANYAITLYRRAVDGSKLTAADLQVYGVELNSIFGLEVADGSVLEVNGRSVFELEPNTVFEFPTETSLYNLISTHDEAF